MSKKIPTKIVEYRPFI